MKPINAKHRTMDIDMIANPIILIMFGSMVKCVAALFKSEYSEMPSEPTMKSIIPAPQNIIHATIQGIGNKKARGSIAEATKFITLGAKNTAAFCKSDTLEGSQLH